MKMRSLLLYIVAFSYVCFGAPPTKLSDLEAATTATDSQITIIADPTGVAAPKKITIANLKIVFGSGGGAGVTSLTSTSPGLVLSGSTGVITIGLGADLSALEALSTTGYAKRTGSNAWALSATIPWTDLSSVPTTLGGYGITDAVPSTRTVNGHALSANVTVTKGDVGLAGYNINTGGTFTYTNPFSMDTAAVEITSSTPGLVTLTVGDHNGLIATTDDISAAYNPAGVAITGGNINGTVIGGATRAAGSFTAVNVMDSDSVSRGYYGDGISLRYGVAFNVGTQGIQLQGAGLNMDNSMPITFSQTGQLRWSSNGDWYNTKDVTLERDNTTANSLKVTDNVGGLGGLTVGRLNGLPIVTGGVADPEGNLNGDVGDIYIYSPGTSPRLVWVKCEGNGVASGWVRIGSGVLRTAATQNNATWTDGTHIYWRDSGGTDHQLDN